MSSDGFSSSLFVNISSIFFVLACLPAQCILTRNEFAQYYFYRDESQAEILDRSAIAVSVNDAYSDNFMSTHSSQSDNKMHDFISRLNKAFRSTHGLLYGLSYVFLVTFIIFPGLSAACNLNFLKGRPAEFALLNLLYLTLFNVTDTLGRFLAGASKFTDLSRGKTLWLAYARTLLFGLFVCSAFEIWWFDFDAFKLINFTIFAFSHGYLSSLCSIKAPKVVSTGEERGNVGAFIGVTRLTGILIGSTLAVPLAYVI